MANLNETDAWEGGIYQLEEDDPVLGGPTGIDNLAPRQLASRTRFLRLRNVTPWDGAFAYPANVAYVSYGGTTWKSVGESTNVAPGTDPEKWVRWGYTAAELAAATNTSLAAHKAEADPHPQYAFRGPFAGVPIENIGPVITVQTPHIRQMVWNGTVYVRAPWHQPGMVLYSYDNPSSIPGYLPIRADLSYSQANYPDLVARLGLTGVGTFSLVELRGEFIRCLDNGRGVNAGRVLRSAEAGDNRAHAHPVTDPTHAHHLNDPGHAHQAYTDAQGQHAHTLAGGGWTGARNNAQGNSGNTDVGSAIGTTTDPTGLHAHNVGVNASGTGAWLSGSGTGISIGVDGSEARPRNVAFPAWISY